MNLIEALPPGILEGVTEFLRLPQPGGTLDVSQQECQCPRRQLHPAGLARPRRRSTGYIDADRRIRKGLAQQNGEVVDHQPFRLPRRGECR